MLELIVVVILAGIGVVFTSYTGEEESVAVAQKSARRSADDLTEGVGIFGIDVGRKRRARRQMKQAERVEAQAADLHKSAPQAEPAPEDASEPEIPQPDAAEMAVAAKLEAEADDLGDLGDDTLDAAEIAARAEVARADAEMTEAEDFATLEFGEAAEVAAGADHLDIAPEARAEAGEPVAGEIPLIDDFDPEEDQIVIAYRPEQAGSGRIGITADPDYPGAARITLGGTTVAIVLDGLGRVKAHHIDLVQEAVRAA